MSKPTKYKMTRKRALEILIKYAAADVAGVGCGIRSGHSEQEICLVQEAIVRIWGEVYEWDIRNIDLFNLGLPGIGE